MEFLIPNIYFFSIIEVVVPFALQPKSASTIVYLVRSFRCVLGGGL